MAISCMPCSKSFKSTKDIHQHLLSAIHGNGLKCDGCIQATPSRSDEALLAHINSKNHLLYCNDCGKSFKAKHDLNQHNQNAPIHAKATAQPVVSHKSSTRRGAKTVVPRSTRTALKPSPPLTTPTPATSKPAGKSLALHSSTVTSSASFSPASKATAHESIEILHGLSLGAAPSATNHPPTTDLIISKEAGKLPTLSSDAPPTASTPLSHSSVPSIGAAILPWSTIDVSEEEEAFEKLVKNCHSPEELTRFSFRLYPYTDSEIDDFLKCEKCGKRKKETTGSSDSQCYYHTKKKKYLRDGSKPYLCCGDTGRGCHQNPSHNFISNETNSKYRYFASSPVTCPKMPRSRAIVLDCEMAGARGGDNEVILLCAVDYLTGTTLLKRYVSPSRDITDWRTQIHGIKASDVRNALNNGEALVGWEAARQDLWNIIDADTILIGHSLQNDLHALRMIHPRVVDSCILTQKAINIGQRKWGLEVLCHTLLHMKIRNNDRGIHDCEEDVFATREIVLSCMRNGSQFQKWVTLTKVEETKKQGETERRRAIKEKKNENRRARYSSSRDDEVMRWEDVAEDFGWPHPDTGYDPWSD